MALPSRHLLLTSTFCLLTACAKTEPISQQDSLPKRANILIAISDDQSYPHASAYGSSFIDTPAFDRIAREGVLFTHAFVTSPGCSPSRASLLTGQYPWQIGPAGTHASNFPALYPVLPDILEEAGYHVGFTGKGWAPGVWEDERPRNPAGTEYNDITLEPPASHISTIDYAANFATFLADRDTDEPFLFWYGAKEPHLKYDTGIGERSGKALSSVEIPEIFPDTQAVRSELLDYAYEIEWFDHHLAGILSQLEATGELENTLIIVTSDNGMPFPLAKANLYDHGTRVPLAIRFGKNQGSITNDLVSFIDLSQTVLDVAGIDRADFTGHSLLPLLDDDPLTDWVGRDLVQAGRERHSSARYNQLSYPSRSLRDDKFLYIRNFAPERWPSGAPQKYKSDGSLGPQHGAYHDIDRSAMLTELVTKIDSPAIQPYAARAFNKRPARELYDLHTDPDQLINLAIDSAYENLVLQYDAALMTLLTEQGDPHAAGKGNVWDSYPRLKGTMRTFPRPE